MAKARSISPKVRARVLDRDGFKCRRCGAGPSDGALEVDHVVSVFDGGSADESNLQTLCRKCNKGKGASAPGAADLGPREEVTRDVLAAILGVDVRSVTNFVNEGMPKESRGRFVLSVCVRWYVDRERAAASSGRGLNDLARARERKTRAEAEEAELRVERMLGNVVPLEVVAITVGRIADRLLPALQNIPSNYTLRLEECGVPAAKAEAVLESIATELTTTLRDAVESDDEDDEMQEEDDISGVA